jgi:hypothetical protein
MLRDLSNLLLRPFHLATKRDVGMVLRGSIDEVRQAARRFRFISVHGVEIVGYEPPADPSCEFLAALHDIHFIRLFVRHLTGIDSLNSLKDLRTVQITNVEKGQSIALDFGKLPALEHASVEWFQEAESIFRASKLRSLSLMYYPGPSSDPFEQLTNLTFLRISACGLTEIKALRSVPLKWLALLQEGNLENFAGLSGHPTIGFLWIEGCRKLGSIEWLVGMNSLETLQILNCGDIVGIDAIRLLPRLRHIHIHGSVKIAAKDLSFLRDMPNLESVVLKGLPDVEAAYWRRRNRRYDLLRTDLAGRSH